MAKGKKPAKKSRPKMVRKKKNAKRVTKTKRKYERQGEQGIIPQTKVEPGSLVKVWKEKQPAAENKMNITMEIKINNGVASVNFTTPKNRAKYEDHVEGLKQKGDENPEKDAVLKMLAETPQLKEKNKKLIDALSKPGVTVAVAPEKDIMEVAGTQRAHAEISLESNFMAEQSPRSEAKESEPSKGYTEEMHEKGVEEVKIKNRLAIVRLKENIGATEPGELKNAEDRASQELNEVHREERIAANKARLGLKLQKNAMRV